MSFIDNVEELELKAKAFIEWIFPVVEVVSPQAAVVLREVDIALGIINYVSSRSEDLTTQANLTQISNRLINNPDLVKDFLDKILFGQGLTTVTKTEVKTQSTVTVSPQQQPSPETVVHSGGGDN